MEVNAVSYIITGQVCRQFERCVLIGQSLNALSVCVGVKGVRHEAGSRRLTWLKDKRITRYCVRLFMYKGELKRNSSSYFDYNVSAMLPFAHSVQHLDIEWRL
jgi:hypothetical protein